MSTTPLSNIQEIIERTLFERIRQELVDKLYLPDISDTGTYPDTPVGWDAYEAAISTIAAGANGFAVEVLSGGVADSRGTKKVPRIVINSGSFIPGALGSDPQRFFQENDGGADYSSLVAPPQTVDYYVNIHLVAGSVKQIRILNSLLSISVQRRGYIPFYNDPNQSFFARYIGYYDGDNVDEGIIEKVYGYEIPDCWDASNVVVKSDVSKMNEITLNTNVQKYINGEWGHNSDPLVVS